MWQSFLSLLPFAFCFIDEKSSFDDCRRRVKETNKSRNIFQLIIDDDKQFQCDLIDIFW